MAPAAGGPAAVAGVGAAANDDTPDAARHRGAARVRIIIAIVRAVGVIAVSRNTDPDRPAGARVTVAIAVTPVAMAVTAGPAAMAPAAVTAGRAAVAETAAAVEPAAVEPASERECVGGTGLANQRRAE
jgi:hypothetical protein